MLLEGMPMSFADPQSYTPQGGSAISLPRTSSGEDSAEYTSADGTHQLIVSHQYTGKRNRRMLKLSTSKIAADVYKPAENRRVSASAHLVVDSEADAYTNAELLAMLQGFLTAARANTDANITKLINGES